MKKRVKRSFTLQAPNLTETNLLSEALFPSLL